MVPEREYFCSVRSAHRGSWQSSRLALPRAIGPFEMFFQQNRDGLLLPFELFGALLPKLQPAFEAIVFCLEGHQVVDATSKFAGSSETPTIDSRLVLNSRSLTVKSSR